MIDSPELVGRSSSPGLSWLLTGGSERSQHLAPTAEDAHHAHSSASQTSLLSHSNSHGGGGNYYSSMSHSSSSIGRMNRKPSVSSGMLRSVNSFSTILPPPELSILQQRQEMQAQQEPMDILSQSIYACTSSIFGLYALEVWKFDKESGSLISIPILDVEVKKRCSGLFIKRITQEADYNSPNYNPSARDAFERLTDTTRLDYVSQGTTDPGVGIAGTLWSESHSNALAAVRESTNNTLAAVQSGVQTLSYKISDTLLLPHLSPRRTIRSFNPIAHHGQENGQASHNIIWRDVDSLAEDPDQPYDERLQLFAKSGFGLAAGITFNVRGFKGIVVFFANPHADARKLRDRTNSQLIQCAAQFIGSAAAMQNPLQNAKLMRTRRPILNWKTLRAKILAVIKFQRPLHVKRRGRSRSWGNQSLRRVNSFTLLRRAASTVMLDREASFKMLSEATTRLKMDVQKGVVDIQNKSKVKTMKWWKKVHGGHASIPPSFNTTQCLWTFVGVFVTHVILSKLGVFLARRQYHLVIGPLGALTTLQYNLTAAPASQPRNAFFGQVVALCTCYLLHQLPCLDMWHRIALAPAIVATVTARLNLIHPPAGATSVVFSSESHGIEDMVLFLVGVSIAIVTAVAINNMSDKRQYPSTKWIH